MRRDRERQPHIHAAAIPLHGRIQKLLDPGEIEDHVKLLLDLAPRHAQDAAVQENVLAAGELGMEPGTDLQQAGNTPMNVDLTGGRPGDSREDFQERALAGTVAADNPDHPPLRDLEIHVLECPERLPSLLAIAEWVPDAVDDHLPEVRR